MKDLLSQVLSHVVVRPTQVGLACSAVLLIVAVAFGVGDARALAAIDQQKSSAMVTIEEAHNVLVRAQERQGMAKSLLPKLASLCGGLPPVADAFVRAMRGWPGVTVKATGSIDTLSGAEPSMLSTSTFARAGGLHLTITGPETSVFGFLVDVDGGRGSLRRSATLNELSRDKALGGDDSTKPAQGDEVKALVDLHVIVVTQTLCDNLSSVANEQLIVPASPDHQNAHADVSAPLGRPEVATVVAQHSSAKTAPAIPGLPSLAASVAAPASWATFMPTTLPRSNPSHGVGHRRRGEGRGHRGGRTTHARPQARL